MHANLHDIYYTGGFLMLDYRKVLQLPFEGVSQRTISASTGHFQKYDLWDCSTGQAVRFKTVGRGHDKHVVGWIPISGETSHWERLYASGLIRSYKKRMWLWHFSTMSTPLNRGKGAKYLRRSDVTIASLCLIPPKSQSVTAKLDSTVFHN